MPLLPLLLVQFLVTLISLGVATSLAFPLKLSLDKWQIFLRISSSELQLNCRILGGALHTDNRASGHSLQWTKALISKPAPFWEGTAVINGEMKELKLSDYKGKYLVFFFYPLDFTFVCPTEILAFNDRVKEFRELGAEVQEILIFYFT